MNNVSIFFNTRVENSGTLAWIGDTGLAPFRYLFNGKTIRIQTGDLDQEVEIHSVASFHKRYIYSRTTWDLHSSRTGMIKTALSVVLLVPGLLFAAFKGLAYAFYDVRVKHSLVKEHFTPVNREIGSEASPIKTRGELYEALEAERESDPENHPTNALIIHGDGTLKIIEGPRILFFNPMKLVLVGASIDHEPSSFHCLDDAMASSGKWQVSPFREVTAETTNNSGVITHSINSVDEALQVTAPRRSWASCKRYHMIFTLARSQAV
jgi:hypothetical protein